MRKILAAAALVLATAIPVPASAAAAPPAAACRIFGYFTWKIPKPSYLGLDEYQLTYNNCGRLVRAWMVCTYLGAHGAHIYEARTGNVVRRGLTRTNCKTFAIGSGRNLPNRTTRLPSDVSTVSGVWLGSLRR